MNPKYNLGVCLNVVPVSDAFGITYKQLAALAEAQIKSRKIQEVMPTTAATVFTSIHLHEVQAWGSAIITTTDPTVKTRNETRAISLTVGGTSAMVPKSTSADLVVGLGERAFARCRGSATTWGPADSATNALNVILTTDAVGEGSASPVFFRFNVSLF